MGLLKLIPTLLKFLIVFPYALFLVVVVYVYDFCYELFNLPADVLDLINNQDNNQEEVEDENNNP